MELVETCLHSVFPLPPSDVPKEGDGAEGEAGPREVPAQSLTGGPWQAGRGLPMPPQPLPHLLSGTRSSPSACRPRTSGPLLPRSLSCLLCSTCSAPPEAERLPSSLPAPLVRHPGGPQGPAQEPPTPPHDAPRPPDHVRGRGPGGWRALQGVATLLLGRGLWDCICPFSPPSTWAPGSSPPRSMSGNEPWK